MIEQKSEGAHLSIVQALVTALLSGLFSGAIIFALNERREREKLLLEKAEQAVAAYSEWVETLSNWPIAFFKMYIGDREEGRNHVDQIWNSARTEYRRAQLLIGIYLPGQREVLAPVYSACRPLLAKQTAYGHASIQGQPAPADLSESVGASVTAISDAGHEGLEKLIGAARDQAHSPFLVSVSKWWRKKLSDNPPTIS